MDEENSKIRLTTEDHRSKLLKNDIDFITDEHEVAAGGAAQADSPPPLVDFGDGR